MSNLALTLVLVAAVLHPTWNLLAKRASGGDQVAFIWLTSALSAAMYVPVVIMLVAIAPTRSGSGLATSAFMAPAWKRPAGPPPAPFP